MYEHIEKLARSVVAGVERSGATVKLFQVAETLPEEILTKMHAPPKPADVPIITANELARPMVSCLVFQLASWAFQLKYEACWMQLVSSG